VSKNQNQAEASLIDIKPIITAHDRLLPTGEETVLTRILVVDNNNETTDLLKSIQESNSLEVISATSGTEGVEMTRSLKPDVVIIDLLISGVDGSQICGEIRKFSQVPILILTAVNKPALVARALDEGADDILLKPMPSGVLLAQVRKLIRRSRANLLPSIHEVDILI
jgi:two-component system KDP operon response regulator KdpE